MRVAQTTCILPQNVKRDPALKQRSLLTNCILIQTRDGCLLGLDLGPLRSSRLGPLHLAYDAIDGHEPLPRRLRRRSHIFTVPGAAGLHAPDVSVGDCVGRTADFAEAAAVRAASGNGNCTLL